MGPQVLIGDLCLNLYLSLYHSIISINPGVMQVTYQGQTFKIDLPATYQECRSRIIEKTKIGERVIWKMEYKDEDQQLCDVDDDDSYTTMLEEYEALQRPPHVYIKVDPASCSVSEIKEKQSPQLDSDLQVSHDVVNNGQENNEDPVDEDQPEQSNEQEKEEQEEGGQSGQEPEEAEDNEQQDEKEVQIENQQEEQEENEASKLDLDEDQIQESQKDESESKKSEDIESPQVGQSSLQEHENSAQQEDDKQQENNPPPNNPKEDTKKEETKDKNQQANQSTVTNLHKTTPPITKETAVQRQHAQQESNHEQKSESPSKDQVESPLESEQPSEQNEALVQVVEEPVKPAAEEPIHPRQQAKHQQEHLIRQDKIQPQTKPTKTQPKESTIKQKGPQINEVLPRREQHCQLVCSFCRSETQHLLYLCGFHNIITCEGCEDNWIIVSKKKRVGSKIRPAPTRRIDLKPCSFCGDAEGLSKLNTFDISMCAGCETKWEFVPSRRHVWTQEQR